MSVIAPKFRLGYFLKGIFDNLFWIITLVTLAGIPAIQIALFFLPLPIIDGEILTAYLAFTWLFNPTMQIPLIKTLLYSDLFRIAAFPGFGFAALIAAGTIFVERKMLAKLQLRVGPFYCGKIEGILQLAGDGLKLISKEIIIPAKADKPLFWAAPVLFVGAAAAFVALIPVAPGGWVVADLDVGLLAVFAVIGFFPIITILSAWSANSKFPFIGGIRALHQMVSFEIPLILSLLGVVILTGTLNLSEIVESQSSFPWIIFMPIGAIVFFIAMLAELERIPFDLPEAESEIVAGWLTEFSGMMYGLVQLGSYLKLYAFAALFVIIFLGGWTGPVFWPPLETELITEGIPIPNYAGDPILTVATPGLPLFDKDPNEWVLQQQGELMYTSGQLLISGVIWFVLKTVGVIFFILLPRGVFPRIRIDMLLHIGWYKLIGLSFVNIFIALGLVYAGVIGPGGIL
ncbi:MAG: NADH-quinone oxidoreductase subunit H [Candidatus Nitrosopelagicus sp.]|jgi:NADH-quinone oxidoreductase subunit H|nr:NADH-quinone oxidoreductase subunit H [Candidatus Nitrosopelagicus sp.]MBT4454816.1 NADH-quinone oxidoreductase subunit H [Candidatus Nitrosopelagicus sp.]MBT7253251.1 NADH-quinone oxidoreductase subunit H [Candidatus Nitrosopelagicus sp.]